VEEAAQSAFGFHVLKERERIERLHRFERARLQPRRKRPQTNPALAAEGMLAVVIIVVPQPHDEREQH